MTGPLQGLRIIELGGLGPGPFAAMLLADHGAEVIRVDRPGGEVVGSSPLLRSRKVIQLDLKKAADVEILRELAKTADGLIEGFRPGTVEKLGLGPDVLLTDNPKLVYGRMTGWGQTGPYATSAGHDINYIALTGALHAIGPKAKPVPPLALVGDMGGGGMFLAFSMCSALIHAQRSGQGQVIDCAMVDGAGLLMTAFYELYAAGAWKDEREANLVDNGAHFYGTYKTKDGKFISIGAIEPHFYASLLERLGLSDDADFSQQFNKKKWPELRRRLDIIFQTKSRDEWCAIFENSDACFAPILNIEEAPSHAQAKARNSFVEVGGILQPTPAPRFSATSLSPPRVPKTVDPGELI